MVDRAVEAVRACCLDMRDETADHERARFARTGDALWIHSSLRDV
jgi:hypothetical protein